MNRRNAMLLVLALAALFAATYVASCHCGDPGSPGRVGVGSAGAPRGGAESDRATADPVGYAQSRHALTSTVTTDADFLTANRGYGIVEDTSVSAGNIRRTLGLPNFGLANVNPTVNGWQSTTGFTTGRMDHGVVSHNGYIYILGGNVVTNLVQYARVNADGTIGTWASTESFPGDGRSGNSAVVVGDYLYVLGGNATGNYSNEAFYTKINPNGTLYPWSSTTSFDSGRMNHASAVYNGYIYIVGGHTSDSVDRKDVQFAKVKSDGTLDNWNSTTDLPEVRYSHSAIAYEGYLYVLGGMHSTVYDNGYYAKINADGTIGNWTPTTNLLTERQGHGSIAYNGYMYLVAGNNTGGDIGSVHLASINADGTLGSWQTSTGLAVGKRHPGVVSANGHVFILGGTNDVTNYADVLFAPIRPDGHVGTTWVKGTDLPKPIQMHSVATHNGFVYLTGGYDGADVVNDVQYAPVYADGSVGPWTQTASFNTARRSHTCVVHNGYLYVLGGGTYSTAYYNDVQFARIKDDGSLEDWQSTISFNAPRLGHVSFVSNGRVYVLGGFLGPGNRANDVQYTTINIDGTLSAWNTTTNFTTAREAPALALANGRVYLTGGLIASGTYSADTQYAEIQPDGSLGAWTISSNTFATARYLHTSEALNGHLYVIAGESSSSKLKDVHAAKINADGSLGVFSATTDSPVLRRGHGSFVRNGLLYLLGGWDGTNHLKDVQFAPINANGTVGGWSETKNFSIARAFHSVTSSGDRLILSGGGDDSGDYSDVQTALINGDGSLSDWMNSGTLPSQRESHIGAAVDGHYYTIGGNGVGGVLTDSKFTDIAPNGSLGQWSNTATPTKSSTASASSIYNGFMYIIGGSDLVDSLDNVQFGILQSGGGGILPWGTTTPLSFARNRLSSAVHGGRVYAVGGKIDTPYTLFSDVQFALVKEDGGLGAWTTTAALPSGRMGHVGFAYNGFLFAIGGFNGGNIADVTSSRINPDGTLGGWSTTSSLPEPRRVHAGIARRGHVYILGGYNTTYGNDVSVAPVIAYSASTKSSFSKQFDLGAAGQFSSVTVKGVLGGVNSKVTVKYRLAGADAIYGAWSAGTDLATLPGTVTISSGAGRYMEVALTIDDNGRLGVTSGMGSSEVSEISLDYSATLKADGQVCALDGECTNNHCVSLICCNLACNAPGQCQTAGSCATGTCVYGNKANTETCNDSSSGTKDDKCDGAGGCAGTAYTCTPAACEDTSVANGTDCTVTYKPDTFKCWTASGQCWQDSYCTGTASACPGNTPKLNTAACDDSAACTHTDKCDGAGGCAGTAYTCASPGACQLLAGAVCNGDGTCAYQPDPACQDAGTPDSGVDAGTDDAGADGGPTTDDGGGKDAGQADGGADGGVVDDAGSDAGVVDAGSDTSYPSDASDASVDAAPDTGTPDTGVCACDKSKKKCDNGCACDPDCANADGGPTTGDGGGGGSDAGPVCACDKIVGCEKGCDCDPDCKDVGKDKEPLGCACTSVGL